MSRPPSIATYSTAVLALACITACSSSDAKPTGQASVEPSGTSGGYAALTAGEASKLPDLIATLDESTVKRPDSGRANFYAATMRFWRISENGPGFELAQIKDEARTLLDHFGKAYDLMPDDARIPAFYGLAETLFGGILSDSARVESGKTHLREGIDRMPTYGHFLQAVSTSSLPANDPGYASTVEHMYADAEACKWESDGAGGYVYPEGALPYPYEVCNNEGMVPHVWEGFFLAFGDFALKGRSGAEKARALYASAKSSPTYDGWPYAAELQKRMDDADATAALYADSDVKNDPPAWPLAGHICTGCHQE